MTVGGTNGFCNVLCSMVSSGYHNVAFSKGISCQCLRIVASNKLACVIATFAQFQHFGLMIFKIRLPSGNYDGNLTSKESEDITSEKDTKKSIL